MSDIHDLIIVGSGPAAYTAAIYAGRSDLNPVVFEGWQYGGSLMDTTEVENFPGFPDGIQGPKLMENMRNQAEKFGADLRMEMVDEIDVSNDTKAVTVMGQKHHARSIILAMGSKNRYLNIPGEQELIGRGVSSCATCDGFFFKQKHVAVVGGGDSAMEEALFLTKFADQVTIIHRSDNFRASPIMVARAVDNEKIQFLTNTIAVEVLGPEGSVTGVRIQDTITGQEEVLDIEGFFVAIGHDPRSELVKDQVAVDEAGHVLVDEPSTRTNVPGVFAVGDLVDSEYQQAITAAGTGSRAAIDAMKYLESLDTTYRKEP